jgi:hypothetical protein
MPTIAGYVLRRAASSGVLTISSEMQSESGMVEIYELRL